MIYFSVLMKIEENFRRICVSCLEYNRIGWLVIVLEVNVIYVLGLCKFIGLVFRKNGYVYVFFFFKKYVIMFDWYKMMYYWFYEVILWFFLDG